MPMNTVPPMIVFTDCAVAAMIQPIKFSTFAPTTNQRRQKISASLPEMSIETETHNVKAKLIQITLLDGPRSARIAGIEFADST